MVSYKCFTIPCYNMNFAWKSICRNNKQALSNRFRIIVVRESFQIDEWTIFSVTVVGITIVMYSVDCRNENTNLKFTRDMKMKRINRYSKSNLKMEIRRVKTKSTLSGFIRGTWQKTWRRHYHTTCFRKHCVKAIY